MGDPRYEENLIRRNTLYQQRADEAVRHLSAIEGIRVNPPRGAFYLTVLFDEDRLPEKGTLPVAEPTIEEYIKEKVKNVAPDKRFVYYLLAAEGICVVPLSGFCSDLKGFRMTLLEADDEQRKRTLSILSGAISAYLQSGGKNA